MEPRAQPTGLPAVARGASRSDLEVRRGVALIPRLSGRRRAVEGCRFGESHVSRRQALVLRPRGVMLPPPRLAFGAHKTALGGDGDMADARYRLLGGPGSPYSLKVRAALRARRIAHDWIVPPGFLGTAGELAEAGKGMIPVMQTPEGAYWADSTPMILALEERHEGRSLLPTWRRDRFLARLIEEFADEWLVLVMFDYRWDAEVDQDFCARRQMAGWLGAMPKPQFEALVERFRLRQTEQLARLGSRETNRPLLRETYVEVLAAMEAQLEVSRFLFGGRPSVADIGLYGQLSQCAIDPSASAVMRRQAIRTFQWVHDVDDASGVEGEWRSPSEPISPGVVRILKLVSDVLLPLMTATEAATRSGADTVRLELRGQPFEARTNPYKAHCLGWLRLALEEALAEGAEDLEAVLREHGCWDALQIPQGAPRPRPMTAPEEARRTSR